MATSLVGRGIHTRRSPSIQHAGSPISQPKALPIPVSNASRKGRIAAKRSALEGIGDELNAIASQNLDSAIARRRVRSAFIDVQSHLDHFLFKMAPTGIQMVERYDTNSGGVEIFCKSWLPSPGVPIKAALFFCHGYGDTCTFFFEGIAKRIAAAGYGVYAIDYPGFGLSQGLHAYIHNFDEMVDCVIERYAQIRALEEVRELPHFLLGQSMGGAVALKVHLKQATEWDGVVLVAPMCKVRNANRTKTISSDTDENTCSCHVGGLSTHYLEDEWRFMAAWQTYSHLVVVSPPNQAKRNGCA